MAFCNSCGTVLTPGTRFCNKCGAAVLASAPVSSVSSQPPEPTPGTAPAPSAPSNNNALKIVLALVVAVVVLGLLGLAAVGFVGWRIAHRTHVRHDGDNVKVETPFGTVESSKDPEEAARHLGVDIYPGARVLSDGTASATFGNMHTVSANFETSDSVDQVASFYKSKFPNAIVSTSQRNHCTIVSNDSKNMISINIQGEGDKTKIQVANVSRKSDSSSSSQ